VSHTSDQLLGVAAELVALIAVQVGIWNDNGYPEPLPFEGAHPIPPLGQRSADNIRAGHEAVATIDELVRHLHALREQLVGELRTDADARAARITRLLAEARAARRQTNE
jgi:hypothetical protein